jgi:hypothetical protein
VRKRKKKLGSEPQRPFFILGAEKRKKIWKAIDF